MNRFFLTTDSTADLPLSYYEERTIGCMKLSFEMGGSIYYDGDVNMSGKPFYDAMRAGAVSRTSQINPERYREFFTEQLASGRDVLHLSFSSGLSGSAASAQSVVEELRREFPTRKLVVVDSLCASRGQGLLLDYMAAMRDEGKTLEEVADWAEQNKLRLCHEFTVDNLVYLQRGGRVSKFTAVVGGILNVKPLLIVNNEGKLVSRGKVRGRRQSLDALVDRMAENMDGEQRAVYICHGDCEEDAQYVAEQVTARFGIERVVPYYTGAVIGSHSGPGTMALFYIGKNRE